MAMPSLIEQDPAVRRVALGSASGFLAFGLGAGLSRYAPGTVGTVVAVPIAVLLKQLPPPLFWILWVALTAAGVWFCEKASRRLGRKDPGGIVWDEMVGFWLLAGILPFDPAWWLAGFLAFRLFDIAKPWPIRGLERRLGGGWGIMLDDLVAALYALAVLALLSRALSWSWVTT